MPLSEERFHEIDMAVESAGYSFDPIIGEFRSTDASEAENNLSVEWGMLVGALPDITREEFAEYTSRKQEEGEKEMEEFLPPDADD